MPWSAATHTGEVSPELVANPMVTLVRPELLAGVAGDPEEAAVVEAGAALLAAEGFAGAAETAGALPGAADPPQLARMRTTRPTEHPERRITRPFLLICSESYISHMSAALVRVTIPGR